MTLGIDIGGSKTLGIVFDQGKIIQETKKHSPAKDWENFLIAVVGELISGKKIDLIGIGVPGVLDQDRQSLLVSPNLKNFTGINFKKIIEKRFGVKTILENDANCYAWGEFLYGAGKKFDSLVALTLGTGLGSSIVINGKLWRGAFGTAPELGHSIIRANGAKCGCGSQGCWEQYASSRFFLRQSGKNPKTLYRLAKEGNASALKLWKVYGYWLGLGLANICNIFEPEAIILGGNMVEAWSFFEKDMFQSFRGNIFSPIAVKKIKLKKSILGFKAGAIGAANLLDV